jgi:hypothetical protein
MQKKIMALMNIQPNQGKINYTKLERNCNVIARNISSIPVAR